MTRNLGIRYRRTDRLTLALALSAALGLGGCFGNGGGDSDATVTPPPAPTDTTTPTDGGRDDDATVTPPPASTDTTAPTISLTSHTDGQTITGERTLTLTWTVMDDTAVASSELTLNGTPVTVSSSNGHYSASLTLADNANTITITASDAAGNTATRSLTLTYPFLAFANGQAATVVIGQRDFDSSSYNQGGREDGNTISYPYGNPTVYNDVLYLPDYGNSRVLGFLSVPTVNNAFADFVLGQPDFTTIAGGASSDGSFADQMHGPQTAVAADGKLFVTDYLNSRILIWNSAPTGPGPADVVVGQPDVSDTAFRCTRAGLNGPESVHAVDGKLIVADTENHRVLIWNTIPTKHGAPADLVLGQADFTRCDNNRGGAPAANTLYSPSDVWSDGTRLIVADSDNHRVLIWNSFPTANGQPADVVLGQAGMTTGAFGTSARDLNRPYMLNSNGNQLFVVDHANHRVLIWDRIPTASYTPADRVLGQPNFNSNASAAGAAGMNQPTGVHVFDGKLSVADGLNARYLIYEAT